MKHNDVYFLPNIIRVIKSKRMRWAGHVARMVRREVHRGLWWRNLRERDHLEDLVVYRKIILKIGCQKLKCECVYWIGVAQHSDKTLVSTVMNF